MATTKRSKMLAARRTRSWWPLVIGSKVPGYTAVLLFIVLRPSVDARQMIPHLARRLRFEQFPMRRQSRHAGRSFVFQIHQTARLSPTRRHRAGEHIPPAPRVRTADRERPRRRARAGRAQEARRAQFHDPRLGRAAQALQLAPARRARPACACSTNTTSRAPRDSASSPSAPEPANKSRQRLSTMECCSQLNKVSRTRSGVGRSPGASGKLDAPAAPAAADDADDVAAPRHWFILSRRQDLIARNLFLHTNAGFETSGSCECCI